ncbi:hypothetical protein [Alloprevotella tannerae]|nr:hypothetical protein [Alloprevotella tannerae]
MALTCGPFAGGEYPLLRTPSAQPVSNFQRALLPLGCPFMQPFLDEQPA